MVVGAIAGNRTTRCRVGRSGDGVAVEGVACLQSAGSRHGEAVGSAGADQTVVLVPAVEGVSGVGRSGHSAVVAMVVVAVAGNRTTRGRAGRGGDGVAVELEVGRYYMVGIHGDAGGVARHRAAINGPVLEGVASGCCSRERYAGAMVVGHVATDVAVSVANRTAVGRIDGGAERMRAQCGEGSGSHAALAAANDRLHLESISLTRSETCEVH